MFLHKIKSLKSLLTKNKIGAHNLSGFGLRASGFGHNYHLKSKNLIVNSDDFGRHKLINLAVKDACNNGICRSASIMAGGEAFDDAVRISNSCEKLAVGVHFTLVMGNPVLPPSEIPTLVNSSGKFHDDFSVFVKRYLTGRINFHEVRAELSAQLRKIQNAGLKISHVDSHQHLHALPGILEIILDLSEQAGIKAVRMPIISGFNLSIGRMGLKFLASLGKIKAKNHGFAVPDNFIGIVAGNSAINEDRLYKLIDKIPLGTTELMVHLGKNNEILQKICNWPHDFEAELNAVTSQSIKEKIKIQGIKIINFAENYNS